ncbi:MAG: Ca-activated chloride channel family protein [Porticoccus sp.]|jgi:Ca-activated chloride channel family protein
MADIFNQFVNSQGSGLHWMRPEYLWAIIPALLLFIMLWRNTGKGGSWSKVISADLLPFLIDGVETKKSRYPIACLAALWIIAVIAVAGPAFNKIPVPVYQKEDAIIVLLDLSPSMLAGDTAPSRVVQARREVLDLLAIRKEGLTGLIAYSGAAFIVSPLTSDTETIALLAPNLAPTTMPIIGNNPIAAIKLADQLRAGAGINKAKLLWITDELPKSDFDEIESLLVDSNFDLAILGIGSKEGAPIPLANGGFLKDANNAMVIPKLNEATLKKLANNTNGIYRRSVVSDSDIIDLVKFQPSLELDDSSEVLSQEFDAWQDEAPWLALLLLPFVAIGFRKGWLLGLLIFVLPIEQSHADIWQNLWATKDQQAAKILELGDAKTAAGVFEHPGWKSVAQYRDDQFDLAATGFDEKTATGLYNKGTALARAGKISEAIDAYDESLKLNPDFEDAAFNKEILENLPPPPENEQQDKDDQQNDEQEQSDKQPDQQNENQQPSEDGNDQQDQDSQSNDDDSESDSDQEKSESEQDNSNESEQDEDSQREPEAQNDEPSEEPSEPQQAPEEETEVASDNSAEAGLSDEEKNAIEQQLRLLQDNPGELLKRKFQYQYEQNGGTGNSDEQRW